MTSAPMACAETEAVTGRGRGSRQRLAPLAHVARDASEGLHDGILGAPALTGCDHADSQPRSRNRVVCAGDRSFGVWTLTGRQAYTGSGDPQLRLLQLSRFHPASLEAEHENNS